MLGDEEVDQADRRAASTATTSRRAGASSPRPTTRWSTIVDTMDGPRDKVAELAYAAN
jgi:hypothetical protein